MSKEQTEKQFEILYGDKEKWSKTTKAVFDVLFNGVHRPVAAREHKVTTQALQSFLVLNKVKHAERVEVETEQQYLAAFGEVDVAV